GARGGAGGGAGGGARGAPAPRPWPRDLCLGRPGDAAPWFRPALGFETATGRWQPCEDPPPGWSRGQAWLLLAVADALLRPAVPAGDFTRLTEAAALLITRGGVLTGRPVPPADTGRPDGPLDTSAAAITAVALLKLARTPGPRAEQYALRAEEILDRLTRSHLTGDDGDRPPGMLLDGCYDAAKRLAVRHELVWGDFFLALALSALHGLADVTRV
ncbi:sugar ABC transporter permease, partial [Streptomyces erythrochromogenes]